MSAHLLPQQHTRSGNTRYLMGKFLAVAGLFLAFFFQIEAVFAGTTAPWPDVSASLNSAQTQLTVNVAGASGSINESCNTGNCTPPVYGEPPCEGSGHIIIDSYVMQTPGQLTIKQDATVLTNTTINFIQASAGEEVYLCPGPPVGSKGTFSGVKTVDVSSYVNGTYTVEVRACSTTNSQTCRTDTTTFTITNRSASDTVPPTVTVTLSPDPGASWTKQSVTATVNCVRADGGPCVNYRYIIVSPTYSGSCSTAGTFLNGNSVVITGHVKICGSGRNGPQSGQGLHGYSDFKEVKVDQMAPTCGNFSPNPASWVNTSQQFSMSGQSDAGGSGLAAASTGTKTCTVTSHGAGCAISLNDVAGNTRICTSPPAQIDTITPDVIADPAPPRSVVSPATISVTLNTLDATTASSGSSGITGARYAVDATASATSGTTFTSSASLVISGIGNHSISYWIRDLAGNERTGTFSPYTITAPPIQCGNGTINSGEQCDDGNTNNGDSCSSSCQIPSQTFSCPAKPASAIWNTASSYTQVCTAASGGSCTQWSPSSDSITDYNTTPSSTSCRFTCPSGTNWDGSSCTSSPPTNCGNGVVNTGEQCDDSNISNGDGCSASCQFETKTFACAAKPANTIWNSVGSYGQTCASSNGTTCTNWNPPDDAVTEYNDTSSTSSCRFLCASGYGWNGSSCQPTGSGNNAQYVSQSVPTGPLMAGQTYAVSVTMKNIGTTTWTKATDYKLGSQSPQDNATWGIGRILLADAEQITPPNGTKTFSFSITAPSVPGTYSFQWRMLRENVEWFGEFSELKQFTVQTPAWSGNVHNSAYGQDMGWVLFGNPAATSYAGLYSGVNIAAESDSSASYSVSGEAYSEFFGKINFSGTKVAMRGGWGVFTGTANFSATAATLVLSSGIAPCNNYKTALAAPTLENYGVCVEPSTGLFYGYAWSPEYGWLSVGGNTPASSIGTPPVRDDPREVLAYQVTTDWRSELPQLTVQTQSDVFLASDNIPAISLVSANSGGTINCNNIDTLLIHKLVPGTTYAAFKASANKNGAIERTFQKDVDYTLSCVNNDQDVTLTLQNAISSTIGVYWLSGNIYGNELTNVVSNSPIGVQVGDPVLYQILPAAPCWDSCTGQASKVNAEAVIANAANDYPIADGIDTFRFTVNLYDRFGNVINFSQPLWFDPTKQVTTNTFRASLDDRISLVQILGEAGAGVLGNATKYQNLQNTDVPASGIIVPESGTTKKHVNSATTTSNQMQFNVTAFAPTNYVEGSLTEDNRLAVDNLRFTRALNETLGLTRLSAVTQEMTNAGLPATERPALTVLSTAIKMSDKPYLIFAPLVTALPEFSTGSYAEGKQAFFAVILKKASAAVFSNPFWLQEMGTQSASGEMHVPRKINFSDFHPTSVSTANLFTSAFNFFEAAKSGSSNTATGFPSLRSGTIHALLSALLQATSETYQMTFIPQVPGSTWQADDRLLYRSFISYLIDGKTSKYVVAVKDPHFCAQSPLNAPGCPLPPSECSGLTVEECCEQYPDFCPESPGVGQTGLSVIGPTHGRGVVSEQISNLEGVSFEKGSFSYSALQESIRRNVANLTRGSDPAAAPQNSFQTVSPDTIDQNNQLIQMDSDLIFSSVDELFTPSASDATTNTKGIGRLLENGRVLWVTAGTNRENPQGFTIVLNDSVLPSTHAARTLIVEGGNVYVKGNITGSGHLAIILLKNRAADPSGVMFTRYGNLLIHPCVTNIRAAVYAEGSLLTMHDGTNCNGAPASTPLGIFDGFGDMEAWAQKLVNQIYFQGIYATQNTAGGTSQIGNPDVPQSGTVGIPNSSELFFPKNTSLAGYSALSEEQKIDVAKRFDVREMRNFARTLVLENDQNGNAIVDDFEDEFAADPTFCDTNNCIPDQNGSKKWTTVELEAQEAARFDGQEWLDVLPYAADGTCAACNPVEAAKFRSAVIFEYDPSLQRDTPIGFIIPREVETSR